MIAPKLAAAGDPLFPEAKGEFFSRNYGERFPYWGGSSGFGSNSGLDSLDLTYHRSASNVNTGLRPAFIQ
jgi:hypothetical protein